jgi:hypothetical protein
MGTFLTSYGDAGYGHEGYAAQVLDDGALTSCYSDETEARMVGQVVAACGCGWTGTTRYPCPEPFDEAAHELALGEWEQSHARPVLQRVQQADLDRLQRRLQDLGTAQLSGGDRSARQLAEQLGQVTCALETAADLARRLAGQAHEQADHAEQAGAEHGEGRG